MAKVGMLCSGRENQRVIRDDTAVFEQDSLVPAVDTHDDRQQCRYFLAFAEEMTDRPRNLRGRKRSRGDLVQKGLKQMVVVLIDDGDANRRARQAMCDLKPTEAGTHDDDVMDGIAQGSRVFALNRKKLRAGTAVTRLTYRMERGHSCAARCTSLTTRNQ